jgi:D-serine deaminase-like pyridoxal phosphate-dependent protein
MDETGLRLEELDTPFLWVDLDRLEENIAGLSAFFRQARVGWRPHFKGLKVPAVARKALAAGAIGMTCAKLGEAEVLAAAGVRDILVANQVVGRRKIERLVALAEQADIKVAVDDPENVRELGKAASAGGLRIGVVVEVDVGMARAGVAPGEAAVELSRLAASTPGVSYRGLMGWEGHAVGLQDPAEKLQAVRQAVGLLGRTAELCRACGLSVPIISGGGSSDYRIAAGLGILTEVQAGGAIFCDATYLANGADTRPALFVRSMVTSRPAPDRLILDAGFKALPTWARAPLPLGLPEGRLPGWSAEHLSFVLAQADADRRIRPGDTFDFVVGYGDSTVFLHDLLYGVRAGRVEVVWPVEGRGRLR